MTNEIKIGKERASIIVRSPEEVSERIQQLEEKMEENDIWGHFGRKGKTRSPEHGPKYYSFEARRNELQWLLGEDIEIA